MDGVPRFSKRRFSVQPVVGVGLLGLGVAMVWLVPGVPDAAGVVSMIGGAVLLVREFA